MEAELLRARGDLAGAEATVRRALELALEAHLRTRADEPRLLELVARLHPAVRGQALAPRYAEALDALAPEPGAS